MSRFYQSQATVWPFDGRDDRTGMVSYGTPYQILCTHKAKSEIRKDATGREYVTQGVYYTEDDRPSRSDFIALGVETQSTPTSNAFEVVSVNPFFRKWRGKEAKFEVVV